MQSKHHRDRENMIVDVVPPRGGTKFSRAGGFWDESPSRSRRPLIIKDRFRFLKLFIAALLLTVFISISGYAFYLWTYKDEAIGSGKKIYNSFKSAAESLSNFKTDSIPGLLEIINAEIGKINSKVRPLSLAPVLNEIPETLKLIKDASRIMGFLNKEINFLKDNAIKFVFSENGELIDSLKEINKSLVDLRDIGTALRNKAYKFDALDEEMNSQYLSLNTDLESIILGLDALINFIDQPWTRHLVVAFENPSEIRPGGGFVGSYADLVIERGAISKIDVNDIYYPDRFSDLKVIPPSQLQGITSLWGARDANWFFDFSKSAEKIIYFLEESNIYKDKGIKFEGVVAFNTKVIEDILEIVGPIDLPEYNLVLDKENFLREVQYEVEAGRDKKPGENPKKILSFITPRLIESLKKIDEAGKMELLEKILHRVSNKDIRLFFEDEKLQDTIMDMDAGGIPFSLPQDFNGNYLAVVNANVAGGKTDIFINQKIRLESKIDSLGVVTNDLIVTRTHNGGREKESWYRAINNNFIKIFTPFGSRIKDIEGNSVKTVVPVADYKKGGYAVDEDLSVVENTKDFLDSYNIGVYKESGKTVFGTWFNLATGKSRDLHILYDGPKRVSLTDGAKYEFVFDKQSGVDSTLEYMIEAPAGFKWDESDSQIFKYSVSNVPVRLNIVLTLKKNEPR